MVDNYAIIRCSKAIYSSFNLKNPSVICLAESNCIYPTVKTHQIHKNIENTVKTT